MKKKRKFSMKYPFNEALCRENFGGNGIVSTLTQLENEIMENFLLFIFFVIVVFLYWVLNY